MTEPVPQPTPPQTRYEPTDAELEADLARRNLRFGLVLFGVFVLLFAGTVVVALVYLALD